jgi:glycerol transport system ATP-binding protein
VATLREGVVTQFGPSSIVYREPADLTTARVFSDPPINVAPARKEADRIVLTDEVSWPAPRALGARPDGPIIVALRPHHVYPGDAGAGVPVQGRVLISEISGSESVVHFALAGLTWVSQAHGVRSHEVGAHVGFALDVQRCLYFGADGRRVAG